MNEEISGGRVPRRRVGILAAALAGIGLLAAACGGDHTQAGSQSTESYYQQAVALAKCMRTHGDPAFPDPGPNGAFPVEPGGHDRSSPQFKAAAAACKNVGPKGAPPASQFQQGYQRLLKYSACMRAHGMPKFPDPVLEDHGVGISSKADENSPQFKAANQACKSLMPGAR